MGRPLSERSKEEKLQLALKICFVLIGLLSFAVIVSMVQLRDCELIGSDTYVTRNACIEWCFDDLRGWDNYDWENDTDVIGEGWLDINLSE